MVSVYENMGRQAAICYNRDDKLGYTQEREACYRAIKLLPNDDKLQARQEFDNAYRQYRSK